MNRTAFLFSVALTALILLLIGGVATAFKYSQVKAAGTPAPAADTSAGTNVDTSADTSSDPAIDPAAIQQTYAQREQAYQDLIAQANQRLDDLQKSNQALQAEVNALVSGQSPAPVPGPDPAQANMQAPVQSPAASSAISPQDAAQIAASKLKRTDLYSVEGTRFNGASAYLVVFSSGDKVYVGTDGSVLSVQRAKGEIAMGGGGGGGGHKEHESEHEHEGGGDD